MAHEQQLLFGPFRLDPRTERLWRGEQEVTLRAKPLAVLRYLVEHPGQVVMKEELLKTVWAGTYVSKTVLKVCVREIRAALEEEVAAPHYIKTVGHLGYQFLGAGRAEETDTEARADRRDVRRIVGRSREREQLQRWLTHAERGVRRIVFVTGEPGIGKTALVDLFVDRVRATGQVRIGRGQCVEQYGAGEAYLPVLEALSQVGRAPGGQQVLDVLHRYAPTWLVQLPALIKEAELEALQHKVQGATRERMLREMAEALEALTAARPLVLVFEDLHWSDSSTLELLAYLARRRERAQLLVLGTYRPTEVIVREHPLKGITQELQAHEQCEELRLELLTVGDVTEYVTGQFTVGARGQRQSQAVATLFQQLAQVIHRRSDGNALFMVNLVEHLVRQGLVVEAEGHWQLKGNVEDLEGAVPESLRRLIERQIERLSAEEQQVLEVASVAGAEFAVAAVAAGSKREVEAVEEVCEDVAWQGHFLHEGGLAEWPDGTVSGRYQFRHALYHNVFYERVAAARQVRLHRQIGEREEQAYGARARETAAELAVHFERGREYRKAVQYLQQAGENAVRRSAHQEAISHLTKGLELLKTLPDTPARAQQELTLQVALGVPLGITKGYVSPEVKTAYDRARELCQQVGETPQLYPVLWALWRFYHVRAEFQQARELGEQLLLLAQRYQDRDFLLQAHHALWTTLILLGEFPLAHAHLEQGLVLYDFQQHRSHAFLYGGHDPGMCCRGQRGYVLWYLGYPDQALKSSQEAIVLAQQLSHTYSLAVALEGATMVHQFRREAQGTLARVETVLAFAREHGFPVYAALGTLYRGWALAEQGQEEEGLSLLRQGLAAYRATGAELGVPYQLARLAEVYGRTGQAQEGLRLLAEALAATDKTHDRRWAAELYRLKGTLTLQSKVQGPKSQVEKEAEECFLQAIEIARRQQAKSLELRAAMSVSRLWQQQGKKKQAHEMLAKVYDWFTEGFETKDLQEAKALLAELG